MKPMRHRVVVSLPLVFVVALLAPMSAQNATKRAMSLDDILSFRAMTTTSLSPDGKWFAYRVAPLEGNSEVIVRSTSGAQEYKFPAGEGAGPMSFSDDSMWFTMATSLTRQEAEAAAVRDGPCRPRRSSSICPTARRRACRRFGGSRSRARWAAGSRCIATVRDAAGWRCGAAARGGPPVPQPPAPGAAGGAMPPRDTRPRGTDLILRELKTGTELNIGNVCEFNFNKSRQVTSPWSSTRRIRLATASRFATCRLGTITSARDRQGVLRAHGLDRRKATR